jgi:hypothetical protein
MSGVFRRVGGVHTKGIGFLTQNAFTGREAARHVGPTPRGWLKFGRMLACRTQNARNREPSREGRASVCNRAVERCFARYLLIGDSDFGAVKPRFLEMAT